MSADRAASAATGAGSPARPLRVLLFTSTLGSGHLRAAQAIEAALKERAPGAFVHLLDFWSLPDAQVAHALRQNYLRLVQERPELYEHIYRLDQRTRRDILESGGALSPDMAEALAWLASAGDIPSPPPADGTRRLLDRLLLGLVRHALHRHAQGNRLPGARCWLVLAALRWGWALLGRRLRVHLAALDPDVVVATEMNAAALFSHVKTHHRLALPALGVLTDFGLHDFWRQAGIDRYCVPHLAIASGAASAPMEATGIPLMPGFRDPPEPAEARRQLRLAPDRPLALVLGGGLGLGVEAMTARVLEAAPAAHLLVMAGRNTHAQAALQALAARYPGRLDVRGWSEHMEIFMRAADVVVGKPGGLTVAETLACGRPLLAACCLRGQESFNVQFIETHGIGRLVDEAALPAALASLLADPGELARIQQHAWALGRRDAAAQVAEAVLALAGSRQPGPAPAWQERVRRLVQRGLIGVDTLYRRWHRLQPVGEVLYVGCSRYRGPAVLLPDGTRVAPGDPVGTLHFNNARISRLDADNPHRAAVRFARLMLDSMRQLAELGRREPLFAQLPVYRAVTWLPPHGERVGFVTEPCPAGPGTCLRSAYFRLLVWAFAPARETRAAAKPESTIYWLTRTQLLRQFSHVPDTDQEGTR